MSAPDVGDLEESFIVSALRSGWIAPLGPDVDKFEQEMADRLGRDHAVALSSGTAALHLAMLAKGIGPGSVVLTSSMTFAATANAITYTGAEPFFVDCLPDTGNMDPALLAEALAMLTTAGDKVAGIVPVDLLGKAVDYTAIQSLAEEFNVPLIADAAESLGAVHGSRPAGAWGDAAAISFNGNKIMTTSGGGMLMTDDLETASHVRYLATQARQPAVHYEHVDIGYNYRLSNLLAALGRAQLSRLDDMISRRREHRAFYRNFVSEYKGISILGGDDDKDDNCWLTSLVIDPAVSGFDASELIAELSAHNIESRPVWKPMHLQPVFKNARCLVNGTSETLFRQGITLPSGSGLTRDQLARVADVITNFVYKSRLAAS
jgi:dTDP-4-amino-4,6-dideoxygalactose transaminase